MVPLTGVSKDKENTHSGVMSTHIHTHAHAGTLTDMRLLSGLPIDLLSAEGQMKV